jgi:PKD repeat protein
MARLVSVLLTLLFLLLILGTVQSRPPPTPNPPAADFSGTPLSGQAPLVVTFTDISTGLVTWRHWDFGDGSLVYANDSLSVSHTYRVPGSCSVSLTVGNPSGRDTQTRYAFVTVTPNGSPPSAFFVPDRAFGTAPFRVQFTDRSRGEPVQWNWDFGDGGYSHEKDPVHIFNEKGRYNVHLTVYNSGGSDSFDRDVSVKGASPPRAMFTSNISMGHAPLTVAFTDRSTGNPNSWRWDFGDGTTSYEKNPLHTFKESGRLKVQLTVKNFGGESTGTRTITVIP